MIVVVIVIAVAILGPQGDGVFGGVAIQSCHSGVLRYTGTRLSPW